MNAGPFIAVAAGGAGGALARWGVGRWIAASGAEAFWSTALVNVVGSFGLGFASMALAGRAGLWQPFLLVGFFGAFTTFSTFAMDAAALFGGRGFLSAALYVSASVALALAAFLGGAFVGRLT